MGDRCVESDQNKKILHNEGKNLYGWAVSHSLPFDENRFDDNVKLQHTLNKSVDCDIGCFVESDLSYPDNIN